MYGLSNTATAVIKITDVNDNPPEFTAEMVRNKLTPDMTAAQFYLKGEKKEKDKRRFGVLLRYAPKRRFCFAGPAFAEPH